VHKIKILLLRFKESSDVNTALTTRIASAGSLFEAAAAREDVNDSTSSIKTHTKHDSSSAISVI
jgi:hypothetical protein